MPSIADVDRDLPELRVVHWVPGVTFIVVGRLVKVTDAWDVILTMLSNNFARVWNDHCRVPKIIFEIELHKCEMIDSANQMISEPWSSSRSKIGEIMIMLYLMAYYNNKIEFGIFLKVK